MGFRLKFLATKIGSGKTPKGGAEIYEDNGVMLLRSQNIHFDGLRLDDVAFIPSYIDQEMAGTRVRPLDVRFNITGASLGRCAVVPQTIPEANVNQHVAIIRLHRERILPEFLCYAIQGKPIQDRIWTDENGSSREGLNFEQIGGLLVDLPPLDVQSCGVGYLNEETKAIDALVVEKERMLSLLEEKRAALVGHAVTKGIDAAVPYRSSGFQWLDRVPVHWRIERAKALFEIRDQRSERGDEELLTVSHLTGVTPRSEKEVYMFKADDMTGYKRCCPGDLVTNTLWAWMGAMGVSPIEGIVSPDYHVYRNKGELLPEFIDLLCRSRPFVAEVNRWSKGVWSSRLRLYPESFFEIRMPVPPKDEQRKIVEMVNADYERQQALAADLRHSIALLKERRSALITAAVTGQIPLEAMSP